MQQQSSKLVKYSIIPKTTTLVLCDDTLGWATGRASGV